MQDLVFVVNPWAGSGGAERLWSRLCARSPELSRAMLVEAADPQVAQTELAALLRSRPVRRVVAVGGDGTLHHVVNTLVQEAALERVTVAVVPAGSGSDLARGLGLGRFPGGALRHALSAPARPVDLLRVRAGGGVRHAVNVASLGISGEVAAQVNLLRRRNPLTYLWVAARVLWNYRPGPVRVWLDEEPWYEGPMLLLAVANGTTFGRGMQIAPHAQPDDGLAEVVLVRPERPLKLYPRLPYLYLGAHLGLPFVKSAPARRVRVEAAGPHPTFELDGELMAADALEVEVLPGRLRLAL